MHYFVKVCVKKIAKNMSFSKISKSIYNSIYYLKTMVTNLFYSTFKGPNVNEIVSYFVHL